MLTAKQRLELREAQDCAQEIGISTEELLLIRCERYADALRQYRLALYAA